MLNFLQSNQKIADISLHVINLNQNKDTGMFIIS